MYVEVVRDRIARGKGREGQLGTEGVQILKKNSAPHDS